MDWYIGKEWRQDAKGLSKTVLDLTFNKLEKPNDIAKVVISIEEVKNLDGRPSKFLGEPAKIGQEQQMEIGTALTPVDCYLELLVKQMIVGEKSKCTIKTKNSSEPIMLIVRLRKILENTEPCNLSVKQMFDLATRYKANGVEMFKQYPVFAHEYFARAAKCLISFKPFKPLTKANNGVDYQEMRALFQQIRTNLAASLLNEKRYDDVIYVTKFVEKETEPSEKSIYRRATAYYHLKEYELTLKLIERVPNYQDKREFVQLQQRTLQSWKASKEQYKDVVKRMFSS